MAGIKKLIDIIFKFVGYFIAALFIVLVVLVFLQVFNRFVLNRSIPWSEEVARFAMIWVALLGSTILMRDRGHMAVNNLLDSLKGKAGTAITTVSVILQAVFLVIWIYGCIVFLPTTKGTKSPAVGLPMMAVDSVFLIAGILMLVSLVDFYILRRGESHAYSEEDEMLKKIEEERKAEEVEP